MNQLCSTQWIMHKSLNFSSSFNMRMLLFPPAGGDVSTYHDWEKFIPSNIDLCIIRLPGRGGRYGDELISDCHLLVKQIVDAIQDELLDLPYVMFGHSMGALLAYETCLECRRRGLPKPMGLMVSASKAPNYQMNFTQDFADDYDMDDEKLYELDDDSLMERIIHIGGIPDIIKENQTYMRLLAPVFRNDLKLCETYITGKNEPFDIPIDIFGGNADSIVSKSELELWKKYTNGPATLTIFPGNHFYFESNLRTFLFCLILKINSYEIEASSVIA